MRKDIYRYIDIIGLAYYFVFLSIFQYIADLIMNILPKIVKRTFIEFIKTRRNS